MNSKSAPQKVKAASSIVKTLNEHGYEALFAGGYVRDQILGASEKSDIDIATNAKPKTIASLFPNTVGVGEQFGVMVVIQNEIPFEVATFRSDVGIHDGRHPLGIVFTDAKTDALRRDFTINGMFYNPLTGEVIDYVHGHEDCENRIIRAIGDPDLRFREDYLRMLRAVRFAAQFKFTIECKTWEAICRNAANINEISPERVFAEINKMLCRIHSDLAVTLLLKNGLLHHILPEVAAMENVEQPPEFHPEGDVLTHTIIALGLLEPNPSPVLAWSVLFHDVGKPATLTISDRVRFHNHDRVGAAIAQTVLRRLRASNELIDGVVACVSNHMNFMNVTKMRLSTLKKFLSRPTILDELELHRVDCASSHGDLSNFYFVKEKLAHLPAEHIKPAPLITGKDLIRLGLTPGPQFGVILSELYDLQLEEIIHHKEDGLKIIKERWIKPPY